jgi:FkbM family methyltransferase
MTWKQRFWFLYRLLARLRLLLSPETVYTAPSGERYFISRFSYVERQIARGEFEETRATYLRRRLGPGDAFFDIGANIGFFTVLAARCGASVRAFEPDPANYERLLRNVRLNDFGPAQVETHPCALGQESGHVLLSRPLTDNYGRSSTVASHSPDAIRVPLRRLDDLLHAFPSRCVVKIDVEGAELKVLDGAVAALDRMPAGSLWLVEVHTGAGIQPDAVAERFRRFGYRVSFFDDATGNILADPGAGHDILLLAERPGAS